MNAHDFHKIAANVNINTNKKDIIKTKRRTPRLLKIIFKLIKKRAKKGHYFLIISLNIKNVDYDFICDELKDLGFYVRKDYLNQSMAIWWEKVGD